MFFCDMWCSMRINSRSQCTGEGLDRNESAIPSGDCVSDEDQRYRLTFVEH